ncbi:protein of unknown function [Nitrospira defluvii]|uniref:Uncharacterized protein n=1 Tax=Nitrospira defluvii TaxID=330214 RepID=D8PFR1_9BACT|nr:protein of unknown function [Nitrospira defluvii]
MRPLKLTMDITETIDAGVFNRASRLRTPEGVRPNGVSPQNLWRRWPVNHTCSCKTIH